MRLRARRSGSESPAYLCLDVEPDGFQLRATGSDAWAGYAALDHSITALRRELERATGRSPVFGWYLRMDPQVRDALGRADHVAQVHPGPLARARSAGDVLGMHVHPLRWEIDRQQWVHAFADTDWTLECLDVCREAFASAFGEAPTRHRYGAGFLSNALVEALDQHGVAVDLTAEPGTGAPNSFRSRDVATGVDSAPRTGGVPDCTALPRKPYRPSPLDFREEGTSARRLCLIPLSATPIRLDKPAAWRLARNVKNGFKPWPKVFRAANWTHDPSLFWDQAHRHLMSMEDPYLALAIRSDAPDTKEALRARQVMEALPRHPIAQVLNFDDPLRQRARLHRSE